MSDYARALAAAKDAALAAGAILRADFHRPEGPRHTAPDHALADDEAEHLIRERLLAACNWGYLGEETGAVPLPPGEKHHWVVDPNDGTSFYIKGHRGTAVSIAALCAGEPVLGVVYSYSAPDDDGDLICWAKGCGPVMRNGRPCAPLPQDAGLEAGRYILVSQDADRQAALNARCVHPARFRTVPSLAYRIALAAAGEEGIAAVSLAHPRRSVGARSWDYAAGHALLLGAGGILLDEHGKPVTYDPTTARSSVVWSFGGPPGLAAELAQRPWKDLFEPEWRKETVPFAHLPPGRSLTDPALVNRVHGCWLGQLIGDALGAIVEFKSGSWIAERYPNGVRRLIDGGTWNTLAGQPTDDSELALMLARTLVQQGRYDPEAVRQAYVSWYRSGPFDVGGTTRAALSGGPLIQASEANGSLMRISPLGLFGAGMLPAADAASRAANLARQDSALTHPNPVCQEACAAYVTGLVTALSGAGAEAAYRAALAEASRPGGQMSVVNALRAASLSEPADYETNQGHVPIALQNAFYQLLHAPSFEEGLVATVSHGGDTDTNGAIAGALLGAGHGRAAIPPEWVRAVLTCRPLKEAGAHKPRPYEFWPIDALELAERLVLAGSEE
jgi:ADP-ribosylglycohydrolase/fructose-1,6-bisphosphatase/inositol monophosphatase family enzyme